MNRGGECNIRAEMLALTYGCVVSQLIKDYNDLEEINKRLELYGYNIGSRLIDEFLAKSNTEYCGSFKEIGEKIAKVGFKMFLGIEASVITAKEDETKSFTLSFPENPLDMYVELPKNLQNLEYSNVICGAIRGALNAINLRVKCYFLKDKIRAKDSNAKSYEIYVELEQVIQPKIENYDN